MSMLNTNQTVAQSLMKGIELPEKPRGGRMRSDLRIQWIAIVELLMLRGVQSAREMAALTEIRLQTIQGWMEEVYASWAGGITPDIRTARREQLWLQYNNIHRQALLAAARCTDASDINKFLVTALNALKSQAKLMGFDSQTVHHTITPGAGVPEAEGDGRPDLTAEAKKAIGAAAARALSVPPPDVEDADVIDIG